VKKVYFHYDNFPISGGIGLPLEYTFDKSKKRTPYRLRAILFLSSLCKEINPIVVLNSAALDIACASNLSSQPIPAHLFESSHLIYHSMEMEELYSLLSPDL